jgi:sigma-B regulation protein RsbU (phosphoserine phosphatase)
MRRALVPKGLPERPALDMASCFLPADANVGGDFFVVGEGRGGTSIVVVGDVVGRGLNAALRASYIRTLLVGFMRSCNDPARILILANEALADDEPGGVDFATAACVVHRPERRDVAWALAGHPPPLWLDEGEPLQTDLVGPPLGIGREFEVATSRADLEPGAGVLVYTDGITEARNGDGVLFGDERLGAALAACAGEDPATTIDSVRAQVESFTGGPFGDDACMLALRARASLSSGDADEVCSPHLVAP